MKKAIALVGAAVLMMAFLAAPAGADPYDGDLYCNGTFSGIDIDGNVYVDYDCDLSDVTIEGNIEVMEGGSLALSDSEVHGNIQADGAWWLSVATSTIYGDVQAEHTAASEAENVVTMNTVYGSIQLEKNWGEFLVADNCVEGNVQIKDNYGTFTVSNTGETGCDGATVEGNIQTEGGSLDLNDAYVEGNVQTQGATGFAIDGSSIDGDVQAEYTQPSETPATITNSDIYGNIQLTENWADFFITDNYVEGDVQLYDNWGTIWVTDNEIMGNLQCCGNSSVVTMGNFVAGSFGCYMY